MIRSEAEVRELCDRIRQIAYELHEDLGHGHLEKVYENGLCHRLKKAGFVVAQQHPLPVYDADGTLLGDYFADLLIDNQLIVELKAAKCIGPEHIAQVLGYLRAARLRDGLLINFGSAKFEIKKLIL